MSELSKFAVGALCCALTLAALRFLFPMRTTNEDTAKHATVARNVVAAESAMQQAEELIANADTFAAYRDVLEDDIAQQEQALKRIRSRSRPPARASDLVDRFVALGYGCQPALPKR